MPSSLAEIARLIGAELRGADTAVTGVADLEDAGPEDLSLCLDQRYGATLKRTRAAGVIIGRRAARLADEAPCPVLLVERPRLALARAIAHFRTKETLVPGIQAGASVDPEAIVDPAARIEAGARILAGARVGAGTLVEHGAVLYAGAEVGKDCVIGTHAVVREGCILGDRVRLDCGVVIGSDGFGFVTEGDTHSRIPQVGNVVVGDDVEIGANSTVDRATLGSTRIGAGSKIDNQVQVGHNVTIGKDVIIAAQVGLSGSVRIGDGVLLGGQVGVADHVVIEAGAQVGAKSGVGSRVPEGSRVAGYPAVPVRQWLQNIFLLRKLRRRMKPDSQRGNS